MFFMVVGVVEVLRRLEDVEVEFQGSLEFEVDFDLLLGCFCWVS
jgi:hypothetical protein